MSPGSRCKNIENARLDVVTGVSTHLLMRVSFQCLVIISSIYKNKN